MATMSYEEALGASSPKTMTYEEAMGAPAAGTKPRAFDRDADEGSLSSAGKFYGTAALKGISHIPGMGGDLRDLASMGIGAVKSIPGIGNGKPLMQNLQEAHEQGLADPILGKLPSGADVFGAVKPYTGEYQPESEAGRAVMGGIEAATSGNPRTALQHLVPNFVGGTTGQVVGDVTGNPVLAAGAGIAGAGVGAMGQGAVRNRTAAGRKENSERIVGQIGREAAEDPAQVARSLDEGATAAPGADVPGLRPTTAQQTGDRGMQGLENRARSMEGDNGANNQALAAQKEGNRRAVVDAGDQTAETVRQNSPSTDADTIQSYGLAGSNPQSDASTATRNAFAALEAQRDAEQGTAWREPALQTSAMYRRRSLAPIYDYLRDLGEVKGQAFPSDLKRMLDTLSSGSSPRMGFTELQDLRSLALQKARKSFNNPDAVNEGDIYGFAQRIADVMGDRSNVLFGDARGAIPAWDNARSLTRRYHEDFGEGMAGRLNAPNSTISPEATLARVLGGGNGAANLRQLQQIPGMADQINPHVENWLVGQMTRNGTEAVTPQQVQRFMADPVNSQIISQVPGLDSRLQSIAMQSGETAQMGLQRQAAGLLTDAVNTGDPEKIVRVIQKNRGTLSAGTGGGASGVALAAVENSARKISRIANGAPASAETLDRLAEGNILTILMGKATGKLADMAGGAAVSAPLAAVGLPAGAVEVGGALAGAGVSGGVRKIATGLVNGLLFGTTKEEATELLQRAIREPELMRELMQKPDPQRVKGVLDLVKKSAGAAVSEPSYVGARQGNQAAMQDPAPVPPGYAAGGQVKTFQQTASQYGLDPNQMLEDATQAKEARDRVRLATPNTSAIDQLRQRLAQPSAGVAPDFLQQVTKLAQQHFGEGGAVRAVKGALSKLMQTVDNPQRVAYPGIYKDPRVIADEAKAMTAPESPALKNLFGVTRDDLYQIGKGRVGNEEPAIKVAPNQRGSAASTNVMTPANEKRIQNVLTEGEKRAPELTHGMDAWYVMDPAYQRLVHLVGPEEAGRRYQQFNTLTSMASPGSDVLTELNRGTAANMMATQGRFGDFVQYGGRAEGARGADFPDDLRAVKGHPYHSTSHALPMQDYLDKGYVDMGSPKVPLYIQSSSVPELGFQTKYPVPDAHFTRGVGMSDVRTNKDFAASMRMPEYQPIGPWWNDRIADPLGITSVQGQGRMWGLMAPQTGVDTAIGAPKLELLADRIMQRSKETGIPPDVLRDRILMGGAHAAVAAPVAAGALQQFSSQEGRE